MLSEKEYKTQLEKISGEKERIDFINQFAWDIRRSYPQKSLEFASQTLELSEKINYKSGLAYSFRCSGTSYYLLSLYEKGLNDLQKAWELFKELENSHAEATVIRTIGNIYHSIDEDEKSIQHYFDALKITEPLNDLQGSAYNYGNIGYVFQKIKKYDDALKYMNKTVEILSKINDFLGLADVLNNIGKVYFAQSNFTSAKKYFSESLEKSRTINHLRGIANANTNLGNCFAVANNFQQSLQYHFTALKAAEEMGEKLLVGEILNNISSTYEKSNEMEEALKFFKKYEEIKSEMHSSISKATINNIRAQFDLEKEKTEKELFRIKNIELVNAYKEIEVKNKDITDSIHYAKRIQDAILPDKEFLKTQFPDSFVFFQPRDIVSGDFFWATKIRDIFIFALADCTGHGVPGAFMSLIGNAYLTEILHDNQVTTPGNALSLLDEKISRNLNKEFSGIITKDGMDIAICAYHASKGILQFAGARRPLLLIRDGNIAEYKPNCLSVGGSEKTAKIFDDYEISLKKNDCLYLFSDGFTDQFGGPKGKKFKYVQFKNMLLSIHEKTMNKQKSILMETIESWKGNISQIDDMLVLGVKI